MKAEKLDYPGVKLVLDDHIYIKGKNYLPGTVNFPEFLTLGRAATKNTELSSQIKEEILPPLLQ